ncbi:MAG: TIGR03087 family PEP-CTERM/XrtA system glycosyltransferase [Pseudomonadota bacterium]
MDGDILFLAHRVPFPPNRGDTIRSAHLLRRLAKIAPVHVGCFAQGDEDPRDLAQLADLAASHCAVRRSKPLALAGVEALFSRQPVSLTAFHSADLARWVKAVIAQHNIAAIFVFSGQMGQYVPDDFDGRVVVDLCDVDSAKFENYASAGQRVWLNRREGRLLSHEEERLAHRADATTLISQSEADLFKSRLQSPAMADIHVVGNGIDAALFDPAIVTPHSDITQQAGPHFVFTGQMDYPPNETAALWAAQHFLPQIRAQFDNAQLHIVGRAPTRRLRARQHDPGLTIWGEVPDMRVFLAAADCVIAPLQIARGVQNKVLEAMAMARSVLLTPQAATGIAARNGHDWMVCDAQAGAMVERIAPILRDGECARAMGQNARQFVLDHHDWGAMLNPLEDLVRGPVRVPLHNEGEEARNAA